MSHSEHIYVCLFVVFGFVVFRVCFVCVYVCFVCVCVCVCVFFGGPGFSSTSPARVMRADIHVRESRGWPSQKTREMGSLCAKEQVFNYLFIKCNFASAPFKASIFARLFL